MSLIGGGEVEKKVPISKINLPILMYFNKAHLKFLECGRKYLILLSG